MRTTKQIAQIPASGVEVVIEGILTRLFFDFTDLQPRIDPQTEEPEPYPADLKECESIDVVGRDKGAMISAIINDRYDNNSYQAISANYELAKDPESQISPEKRAEYLAEHEAFQNWRAHAKEIAGIAISVIENLPAAE